MGNILGFNILYQNIYLFTAGVRNVYIEFNLFILILVVILAGIAIVVITTTLITHKKRDIAIMKSLGTIPRMLYSFYMKEVILLYIVGFLIGLIIGLIFFGMTILFLFLINYPLGPIQIDIFWTPIFFFSTLFAVYVVSGYVLRKIGLQKIHWILSKDIPCDYDTKTTFTLIPRWLSRFGYNLKIAIINLIRRKREFKRYLILFIALITTIFTLNIGIFVLTSSTENWISKSQGENIIVLGHKDVVYNYTLLYQKFSDNNIVFNETTINFTRSDYLFDTNIINSLESIVDVQKIDERLIIFSEIREINGTVIIPGEGYRVVGEDRYATIPLIGLDPNEILQDFEIEGEFFTADDSYDNITIGDSLATYTFSYALNQRLQIESGKMFHIKGVIIDSLYNGFTAYFDLDILNEEIGLPENTLNLILIQTNSIDIDNLTNHLQSIVQTELGSEFIALNMNEIFNNNLFILKILNIIPLILIILFSAISLLSLYNYQKVSLHEKIKDFIIMKAIGAPKKSIRRILFIENLFIIIISSAYALAFSMLINIIFLFERVNLPPLYVPFLVYGIYFIILLILNSLSLIPLIRKIKKFTIKDFEIY